MEKLVPRYKWIGLCVVLGFMLISCGGSASNGDISGIWKSDDGDMTLSINLNGEQKTIEMQGKTMLVTIEEIISDKMVKLNVKEDENTFSTWTFQRRWSDNGSDFTLNLVLPDGNQENLIRVQHS
ncbi:MAG: hypothetical protein R6U27_17500 [Desulfobacterales bacterium]